MEKLMARLKELDSKTWGIYWHIFRPLRDVPGDPKRAKVIMEHTLQGIIQKEIKGRGWSCYQYHYSNMYPDKCEYAYISPNAQGESDTPAKALLIAYIKALEAQT